MNLHKPITVVSVKVYCWITLICPIIWISHIAQLLIRKFYCFCKGLHISFKYARHNHFFARWREKYLSKRSPLEYTCSWRDKLIVLFWKVMLPKHNMKKEEEFFLNWERKCILLLPIERISIPVCHVLWKQFYCFCIYTKTERNRSKLFKKLLKK